jgi:hypothetical protein
MHYVGFIRGDVRLHALKYTCIIANLIRAKGFPCQLFALIGGGGKADSMDRKPLCILNKNFLEALE